MSRRNQVSPEGTHYGHAKGFCFEGGCFNNNAIDYSNGQKPSKKSLYIALFGIIILSLALGLGLYFGLSNSKEGMFNNYCNEKYNAILLNKLRVDNFSISKI